MFENTDISAFLIQIVLLVLCISTYPFLNFFIIEGSLKIYKDSICKLECSDIEILGGENFYKFYVFIINSIPLLITIFVPEVAVVLGNIGCFIGLFTVYLVPITTYWTKLRNELIELQKSKQSESTTSCTTSSSTQDDDFCEIGQSLDRSITLKKREFHTEIVLGTIMMLYGLCIFFISVYNPYN